MDIEFNKREDQNKLKLSEINQVLNQVKKGGGEKRLQKLRDEGKMTAVKELNIFWIILKTLLKLVLLPVMRCMPNMEDVLVAV